MLYLTQRLATGRGFPALFARREGFIARKTYLSSYHAAPKEHFGEPSGKRPIRGIIFRRQFFSYGKRHR